MDKAARRAVVAGDHRAGRERGVDRAFVVAGETGDGKPHRACGADGAGGKRVGDLAVVVGDEAGELRGVVEHDAGDRIGQPAAPVTLPVAKAYLMMPSL